MKKTFILLVVLVLSGCSRAEWSTWKSVGARHKVTLWSGNQIVKTYYTTGKVEEHEGGMCFFQDDETRNPIYIYGTWTVEIVD